MNTGQLARGVARRKFHGTILFCGMVNEVIASSLRLESVEGVTLGHFILHVRVQYHLRLPLDPKSSVFGSCFDSDLASEDEVGSFNVCYWRQAVQLRACRIRDDQTFNLLPCHRASFRMVERQIPGFPSSDE